MSESNWQDLLKSYIEKHPPKSIEEQEKEACDLFLEYMKEDESSKIPKFFYKKPMSYNDLYYSVKVEAKTRHLGLKQMEIPEKSGKIINRTERPLVCAPQSLFPAQR